MISETLKSNLEDCMNNLLKKIPMPFVGTMLGVVVLGNLVQSHGAVYRSMFGTLAGVIFVLTTMKLLINFEDLKKDLEPPIGASVFPTYAMAIMVFSTYFVSFHKTIANIIWILGLALHLILIVNFTRKYMRNFNLAQVLPSWFIVYVGVAVAAVTGKVFHPQIAKGAFFFGLASYLILLMPVIKRLYVWKDIPDPAKPTLAILAAPGSLCLAGYLNAFEDKNRWIFLILLIVSQGMYLYVLFKLPQLLKLKFYPSYSSFTFPLVISAMALKLSNVYIINQGYTIGIVSFMVQIEELIAVIMTLYVVVRYFIAISQNS